MRIDQATPLTEAAQAERVSGTSNQPNSASQTNQAQAQSDVSLRHDYLAAQVEQAPDIRQDRVASLQKAMQDAMRTWPTRSLTIWSRRNDRPWPALAPAGQARSGNSTSTGLPGSRSCTWRQAPYPRSEGAQPPVFERGDSTISPFVQDRGCKARGGGA